MHESLTMVATHRSLTHSCHGPAMYGRLLVSGALIAYWRVITPLMKASGAKGATTRSKSKAI